MAGRKGRSGRRKKYLQRAESAVCIQCKEELPAKDFYPNAARPNGLSVKCIECSSDASKESAYRREIKAHGAQAFQQKIIELEDRVTRMRRTLRGFQQSK